MRDKKFNPTQGFHSLERKKFRAFSKFFSGKNTIFQGEFNSLGPRQNIPHSADGILKHNFYNKNIDTLIKFQWNIHKMKTYGIIIWYNQMNLSNLNKNGIVWTIFMASCWHYNYRKYWIFIHLKWTQLQQLTITSLVHSSKLDQVCNCF